MIIVLPRGGPGQMLTALYRGGKGRCAFGNAFISLLSSHSVPWTMKLYFSQCNDQYGGDGCQKRNLSSASFDKRFN